MTPKAAAQFEKPRFENRDAFLIGGFQAHSLDGSCEYVAGVEVSDLSKLPSEFAWLSLPAHRYAIFAHHEHVSKLGETIGAIRSKWLPGSGAEAARDPKGTPAFFERYGEGFNPQEGKGDVEVWVPIKS